MGSCIYRETSSFNGGINFKIENTQQKAADLKYMNDISINFTWIFKDQINHIRVQKGRHVAKLKSDIAEYLMIPLYNLRFYQDGKAIISGNAKIDTLDPTKQIIILKN